MPVSIHRAKHHRFAYPFCFHGSVRAAMAGKTGSMNDIILTANIYLHIGFAIIVFELIFHCKNGCRFCRYHSEINICQYQCVSIVLRVRVKSLKVFVFMFFFFLILCSSPDGWITDVSHECVGHALAIIEFQCGQKLYFPPAVMAIGCRYSDWVRSSDSDEICRPALPWGHSK